jgi:hypothetical protein
MSRPVHVLRAALPCALLLFAAQSASASLLIGTASGTGSTSQVNAVIDAYNMLNMTDLPAAEGDGNDPLVKLQDGAFTPNDILSPSDFTFYRLAEGIATNNTLTIGEVFNAANLVAIDFADLFDDVDGSAKVVAFTYEGAGTSPFNYYVSKNGPDFTVWTLMEGFNPVYVESTPLDDLLQPNGAGLSHLSFFGPTGPTINEIPEPASAGLAGLGLLSSLWFARRRRARAV